MEMVVYQKEWTKAVLAPAFRNKGSKNNWKINGGPNCPSKAGKVYGKTVSDAE